MAADIDILGMKNILEKINHNLDLILRVVLVMAEREANREAKRDAKREAKRDMKIDNIKRS